MSASSAPRIESPTRPRPRRPQVGAPEEAPPPNDLRGLRRRLHAGAPRRPAGAPGTRRARAWGHLEAHAASLTVAAGVLIVAALVLGIGIQHYPGFSDDEGTYVAQAWAVRDQGSLAHYTYWYDHPPLGWLQLAAATWLLSPLLDSGSAVADGRTVMLIPALASAALLFVLARRLGFRRSFAAGAVLLFVLSPLAVANLRMVFLDNMATPWVLASFVLAASPERRLWAYAGSGVCFAIAVLTKETSLLVLPGLLVAVSQGVDRRTRAFCLTAFATMLGLGLLVYPLFAVLKGELLPGAGHVSLVEALRFQLYGRASTGSALTSGTLSRQLVSSWLSLDAWLLLLGIAALPVGLWIRRLRPAAVALACLVVMGLRPGYLPQPYVVALLPFCALLVMGAADHFWGYARGLGLRRVSIAAAVLYIAVLAFGRSWYSTNSYAMTHDQTGPVVAAQRWIARHIDHRARVLVDDTMYVDLVRSGFAPRFGAVWFYKLDFTTNLDPSIVRHLPQGWRAFDYVLSTDVIRSALVHNPSSMSEVRLALRHSTPVKTFGAGARRVEVRRITGVGTGSGFVAPPVAPAPPTPAAAAPVPAAPVAAPAASAPVPAAPVAAPAASAPVPAAPVAAPAASAPVPPAPAAAPAAPPAPPAPARAAARAKRTVHHRARAHRRPVPHRRHTRRHR